MQRRVESLPLYHRGCRRVCLCKWRRALKHKPSRSRCRSRCRVRDSSLPPCHLHLAGMSLPGCLALAMDTRCSARSISAPGITARSVSISYQDDSCMCTSACRAKPYKTRGMHVTCHLNLSRCWVGFPGVLITFLGGLNFVGDHW